MSENTVLPGLSKDDERSLSAAAAAELEALGLQRVTGGAGPAGLVPVAGRRPLPKRAISAPEVLNEAYQYPQPVAFSRGMRVELPGATMLYLSGTASVDEQGNTVHPGDFDAQCLRTFRNLTRLLVAEGASWHDVVRTSCYLRDIERDYDAFNGLRTTFMSSLGLDPLPASTGIQARLCRSDLLVEIEAIAVLPGTEAKRVPMLDVLAEALPDLGILRRSWPEYGDASTTHVVDVRGVQIGGPECVVIAGPCAVESYEQTLNVARAVKAAGGQLLRGGVFKPRTNPHSFQGLGVRGLEILAEVRRLTGLGFVTEVMDPRLVQTVAGYADMLQIGSRSMQNFPLLTEVGRCATPVLLKRGWSSTLTEWLCAAEYVAKEGNRNIVLCERGVRTASDGAYARNVLDLNVIEPSRRATPLPVIVDPSHAPRNWTLVAAMSEAAVAAGAQGLLVEVVEKDVDRSQLQCDAEQGVPPDVLERIVAMTLKIEPGGRR